MRRSHGKTSLVQACRWVEQPSLVQLDEVQLEGAPWLAAVYNPGVGVGRIFDVPCYPTQLWEILAALTLFGLLSWTWAKKRMAEMANK